MTGILRAAGGVAILFALVVGCERATPGGIPPEDAKLYLGKRITVAGKVESVGSSRRGATFLNFGAPYPNQTFTAVAFQPHLLGEAQAYKGKTVYVTGTVKLYRAKPEIIIASRNQLHVK